MGELPRSSTISKGISSRKLHLNQLREHQVTGRQLTAERKSIYKRGVCILKPKSIPRQWVIVPQNSHHQGFFHAEVVWGKGVGGVTLGGVGAGGC